MLGVIMSRIIQLIPTGLALKLSLSTLSIFANEEKNNKKNVDELEEVIVTKKLNRYSALKSATPIMETTRTISVIDQQAIEDKGAQTLDDTFMYVPGVIGQPYGFETRADFAFVRGFEASLYQDSLQSIFGNYNNARPHIFTLEQVEILKGPASVLYGAGQPGGIINAVSKTPKVETQRKLAIEVGNFDHKQIAADFTGAIDAGQQWLYRFVAVAKDSGTQVDKVDDETYVIAPSLTWQPSEQTAVTALLNFTDTKSDTSTQFLPIEGTLKPASNGKKISSSTYLGDPDFNQYDTENQSITLLANHAFNDILTIEATARHTEGSSDYRQAWPSFIPNGTHPLINNRYVYNPDGSLYKAGTVPRTFYIASSESTQTAADFRAKADFSTGLFSHQVLMGVQHQRVKTQRQFFNALAMGVDLQTGAFNDQYWINLFDPIYGNIPSDAEIKTTAEFQSLIGLNGVGNEKTKTTATGVYLNDQIEVQNLIVNFGIRYDESETNQQKDDAVSLSAGLLYGFDSGVSPYLSYAESFDPVIGTDDISGNTLKPVEAEQFEVGVKYQHELTGVQLNVAYFDLNVSNIFNPNQMVNVNSQQEGKSTISGVEVEALLPLGDFSIEANFSQLDTENPEGFQLASVPKLQAATWIGYRPSLVMNGFKTGFGLRYKGETQDGTDTVETPSVLLSDLMIGYEKGRWDFMLNVQNLTDKTYLSTCLNRGDCYYGKRRSVIGTLAFSF